MLIGSLDDFAPFRFEVVGLRKPPIVLSRLGVSLNNFVGLVPTSVLCSSLVNGLIMFVGSEVDMLLLSVKLPWCTQSAVPSGSVSGCNFIFATLDRLILDLLDVF